MKQLLRAALEPAFDPTLATRERILRESFFRAARESECVVVDLAEQRRRRVAG